MILSSHLYWKKNSNPKTFWNGRASKTKVMSLLLGLSCLSASDTTWNAVFSCDKIMPSILFTKVMQMYSVVNWTATFRDVVILAGVCNIHVVVDETCRTDVFSKRIYLMRVILSCVTNLRLSLVAVKALCLVLTFFDLWYQIVLVGVVNFFQGKKVVLNSAYLKRRVLCADMLKEQSCST